MDETTAVCMNTSTGGPTEGPTAAQETTGAAGDANTTAEGIPKLMDTSGEEGILTREGTPGRLTAESTTKRKG